MATNHQEFTDSNLGTAADEDTPNLAILADMATRALSPFLLYLAAKAGQSSHEVGRISIRNDPDRKLYEQMEFLEQARQDLPLQHQIKAAIAFSSTKNCAR
jgi:hypothetical protein